MSSLLPVSFSLVALMISGTPSVSAPASIVLTLPDGSTREVAAGTLARDVVGTIGARLLQAALAVAVDGEVQDLMTPLRKSGAFVVITDRDPRALAVLRHSGAHILATAVRRLRPDAKIGFGPAIDDGFYYDFEVEKPFTPEDLAAFEAEMKKVVAEKYPFVREEVSLEEAKGRFADDPLKLERLADFEGTDEVISTYTDGPFIDLCRGPHVPDTSHLKHFKLLHTAGAYWRGDVKRQMLQRIYATAFFKKDELETHLHNLEEAKKRDHRVLGKSLGLFQLFPHAPGAAFWTPKGTMLYNTLEAFVRERQQEAFQEVKTPLLYNKMLWEQSGHWGKYKENMFLVLDNETGEHDMSLKPMNCPSHYVLFGSHKHSYRELPVRYVTFDVLHRNELSGALSGLTRVRQFSQDDCHVFLREDQIASEVRFLLEFILDYYDTFGLKATLKFATRPEQRIGSDELWDRAEGALRAALESTGRPYELKEGDGAFYGPKIDFDVTDSIGRAWQLGTIQLDYNAPERFDLTYTGDDNAPHRPVVIHRAVSGSFERFIAILIEHFGGAFPVWLAPEQVRVIPIAIDYNEHAQALVARMKGLGIRATLDARNETLNYRVREGEVEKVPYMCVIGRREAEEHTVALRSRGAGKKQEILSQDAFVARVLEEIRTRALPAAPEPTCRRLGGGVRVTPEALLDLFLLSPVGLVEVDEAGRVEVANLAARRLLTPFTRTGSLDDLFDALGAIAPDLSAKVRGFDGPRGVVVDSLELLAPGQKQGVFLSIVKVAEGRMVAVATDAAELAAARGLIARLQQRLEAVEGAVREYAIYTLDIDGRIDSWSVAAERVHQWPGSAIVGQSMTALLPPEHGGQGYVDDTLSLAARNGWCEEEGHRQRQDGTTFWANTVVTALRDAAGETVGYSVVTHDASERRKLEERLRDDASSTTDYLTGVSARRAYFDVAQSEVARARRYGQPLTMLLVDPDHFRALVDEHGEAFGNEWLRAIAWVCRQESRTTDVVGRVGGEAFAVLLPSTELSGGLVLAERIRERMQRHVFAGEFQFVRCTLCVGVAEVSEGITSVDGLLAAAGTAVERARQAGMNLVVGFDD